MCHSKSRLSVPMLKQIHHEKSPHLLFHCESRRALCDTLDTFKYRCLYSCICKLVAWRLMSSSQIGLPAFVSAGCEAYPSRRYYLRYRSRQSHCCPGVHARGLGEAAVGSIRPDLDEPLVPTYQGRLENKADTVYLIGACLRGKLLHARRRPRDGEATINENIFV